ncbi:MAG: hypothetical protein WC569_07025, partial [Candidatus Omnitrophota bacterium]
MRNKGEYNPMRQQNVLLEKIYSEVKIIAEGHAALVRGLEEVNLRLDGHDQRFNRIEMVLAEHTKDIKQLKAGQERLEHRMDNLENRMGQIENRMDQIENRMGNLENRMDLLERRMGN